MQHSTLNQLSNDKKNSVTVRFAGDSGDGVQIIGDQFTLTHGEAGNDFVTLPDYPAEIRAPIGTRFGVSAYQIQLADHLISTPGDQADVLVAFNPAALVVNLNKLKPGALIVVDASKFSKRGLLRAELDSNPLKDGSLNAFKVLEIDISKQTVSAVKPFGLSSKNAGRCKNFWALGLVLWLFSSDRQSTLDMIAKKFAKKPTLVDANSAAVNAGHCFGETAELQEFASPQPLAPATYESGLYRSITGHKALSLGIAAGLEKAGLTGLFCSYPITPASPLLHDLSVLDGAGIATFQAEDEIAAAGAAIGASYAGSLGITSSSGPGIALKTEAIGLAIATELPLIIVNAQRGGPSTGLPTKAEQSDLYQAVYGRNGDAPLPVLAPRSPGDCFLMAIEAIRIAVRHMTPVILLTDAYITNSSQMWKIPDLSTIPAINTCRTSMNLAAIDKTLPFKRNPHTLGRNWIVPGQLAGMHRIGGLEKDIDTGNISYDDDNHQQMTDLRADKVARVADYLPEQSVHFGPDHGEILLVGWGSTYGALLQAAKNAQQKGHTVSLTHFEFISPLPENAGDVLRSFNHVVVVEMNNGQLATLLKDKLDITVSSFTKVTGQPFNAPEIEELINEYQNSNAA
ncbi:MAG: 2-oxoacid:acceptor oxidoreductase subunit alpha [Psychrosphaera sp.]|nr:2-oxoacid:acceptor oxidoreductase subunit alpha [Psychrosphaera sp.]